jgi:6-pyruvoyltetrahydropterin/6-carboxytetrahydropterin synthase
MLVAKEFTFDAAHQLRNYIGPCANLHGHTYKFQVVVSGNIKRDGMVIDFTIVKNAVNKKVISVLDHTFLNDTIQQPTAENLVVWMWNQLAKDLPLYEIKLWETPTSFVVYRANRKTTKK